MTSLDRDRCRNTTTSNCVVTFLVLGEASWLSVAKAKPSQQATHVHVPVHISNTNIAA